MSEAWGSTDWRPLDSPRGRGARRAATRTRSSGARARPAGRHDRARRTASDADARRGVRGRRGRRPCSTTSTRPPTDAYDAYLRLHLLSHRLVKPHGLSLEGIFGVLPNVAWTSHGPVDPAALPEVRMRFRGAGEPLVRPRRRQVPAHDRLRRRRRACGSPTPTRVRLGAHLAEGTTVMHEGFVNYNAGTLGASMVEGRISAGVVVGDGSRHRRRRLDHGHAVGRRHRRSSRSASAACWAPTPASGSRSATTASSRPGSTSPPARA